MASVIKLRTISAVDDKRIQLTNSQFGRQGIGTSWTKLRVGVRLSVTDSGANIASTPRLALGVCSGTTNMFGDATTTNFCGYVSNSGTWTRSAGPPASYNPGNGSATTQIAKRVGTTLTFAGNGGTCILLDATTANRSMLSVTITKGSPNYTFEFFVRSSALTSDVTAAQFLTQMEASVPALTNHTNATGVTLAVDQIAGNFDTINVSWDHSDGLIEISDIAVAQLV